MPTCPACGSTLVPPYRYCSACGAALVAPPAYPVTVYPPPPRKDSVALIVVLVIVVLVVAPIVVSAVLYVLVSGLIGGPTPPGTRTAAFVLLTATAHGATLRITSIQPSAVASNFQVALEVNGTGGPPSQLPASSGAPVTVVVPAYNLTFTVQWLDVNGDGALSAGDDVTMDSSVALVAGTTMDFFLFWTDGTHMGTTQWTVP